MGQDGLRQPTRSPSTHKVAPYSKENATQPQESGSARNSQTHVKGIYAAIIAAASSKRSEQA